MKRNRSMDDDEDVAKRGHGRDDAPTHLGAQVYLEYILYLSIPCRAHECHPGRSWRDSSAAAFEHEYADELLVPHHTIADASIEGGAVLSLILEDGEVHGGLLRCSLRLCNNSQDDGDEEEEEDRSMDGGGGGGGGGGG